MLTHRRLILLAVSLAACDRHGPRADTTIGSRPDTLASSRSSAAPASLGKDTLGLVVIDRPTVVGFFQPAADSAEAEEPGYTEGVAHISFGVTDARDCLGGRDSARTRLVVDTAFRARFATRVDTIRLSAAELGFGIYLMKPGSTPLLINQGPPSMMGMSAMRAIPAYYHRPPCKQVLEFESDTA